MSIDDVPVFILVDLKSMLFGICKVLALLLHYLRPPKFYRQQQKANEDVLWVVQMDVQNSI